MLTGAAILAAALVGGIAAPANAAQTPTEAACNGSSLVSKTLTSGATWQLCWRVDTYKGLVVEKVAYKGKNDATPIVVLDSLAIAQLNVPYDTGFNEWNDITSYGFGGRYGQKMTTTQCPKGEIRSSYLSESRPSTDVLCVTEEDAGLAYNAKESRWGGNADDGLLFSAQSTDLVLNYIAKVDWYEYETEFRFSDDGEIDVRLGATGDLAPSDYVDDQAGLSTYGIGPDDVDNYGWPIGVGANDYAVSHYHSAIYRVDFGVGGGGAQRVEQFDSDLTGTMGRRGAMLRTEVTPIETEGMFTKDSRRIWRVVNDTSLNADGHARSYEIIPSAGSIYAANPETSYDVAFTQLQADELFASHNLIPSSADLGVPQYVSDAETLTDPVAWVNVGFHHIVRDEDQSPMPIHWQGFTLYPRDFSAQSPVIPEQREYVNGNVGRINTPTTPTPTPTPTTTPTAPPTSTPTPTPTPSGTPDPGTGSPTAGVALSRTTATPGSSITVTGSGFESGETVTATMHSTPVALGSYNANSFGAVEFTFTVPLDATEGSHRVELTSPSGVTVSSSFQVERPAAPALVFGQLGNTGTQAGVLVTSSALLLLLGGALAIAAAVRRRFEGSHGTVAS